MAENNDDIEGKTINNLLFTQDLILNNNLCIY